MTTTPIDKARDLAKAYVATRENSLCESEFHHIESLPEGGYFVNNRHRTEEDWIHFVEVSNKLYVGGSTYISVHPESGEVRSCVIGE